MMNECCFCGKSIDAYASNTRLMDPGLAHRGRVACAPCLALHQIKNRPIEEATLLDLYTVGVYIGLMVGGDRNCSWALIEAPKLAEKLLEATHAKEIERS